jgi:hypothetical protein
LVVIILICLFYLNISRNDVNETWDPLNINFVCEPRDTNFKMKNKNLAQLIDYKLVSRALQVRSCMRPLTRQERGNPYASRCIKLRMRSSHLGVLSDLCRSERLSSLTFTISLFSRSRIKLTQYMQYYSTTCSQSIMFLGLIYTP